MTIDPIIVQSVPTLTVAAIGVFGTYLTNRRQGLVDSLREKNKEWSRKYVIILKEVEALHKNEEALCDKLSQATGQSAHSIKIATRREVEEAFNCRPTWTALDAKQEMQRIIF